MPTNSTLRKFRYKRDFVFVALLMRARTVINISVCDASCSVSAEIRWINPHGLIQCDMTSKKVLILILLSFLVSNKVCEGKS